MKIGSHKKGKFALLFLLTYLLCSVSFLLADKGPQIKFNEEKWDFGKTKQGKVLNHVFVFKNEGDSPLIIDKVLTSCGCTAALVSEKKILPGKKGEIKVTLNTRGYEGNLSKYIYVESNDPDHPQKQLTVAVAINVPPRPKIELDRYSLDLGLVLEGEDIQTRAKVKNKGELELEVEFTHKDATFYQNGKKVSFPLKIEAGKEEEIEIKIPARKRGGLVREYVLIKSNDPMRPNLSLYLSSYCVSKKQLKELLSKYKDILK